MVDQLVWADVTTLLLRRLLKDPSVHALILLLHARVLTTLQRKFTAILEVLRGDTQSRLSLRFICVAMLLRDVAEVLFLHEWLLFLLIRHKLRASDRMMTECSHLLTFLTVLQEAN